MESAKDLMLTLGLHETIDQLAMANSVHWYHDVMRREDCNVLRKALHLVSESGRKAKETWKKQVEKECPNVGHSREDALCRSQ